MCQLDKVKAKPCFQKRRNTSSHSDLAENAAQFVKIHRLGKMEIESSFSAALDIVTRGKARERHGFDGSFSFRLGNNVVAITVWQRNITQHDVELFRVDHVQGAPRVISSGNVVAEMIQKARQRFQSVAVIFYHQDAQTLARIIRLPSSAPRSCLPVPRSPITGFCAAVHRISLQLAPDVILSEAKNLGSIDQTTQRCFASLNMTAPARTMTFRSSDQSEISQLEKRPQPVQEVGRVLAFF